MIWGYRGDVGCEGVILMPVLGANHVSDMGSGH